MQARLKGLALILEAVGGRGRFLNRGTLSAKFRCFAAFSCSPTVAGKIMVPDDVHVLVPRACDCVMLVTWQGEMKIADGVEADNQLTLRWGACSGLSGWAQHNHRVLISDRGRKVGARVSERFQDVALLPLGTEEGATSQECRRPLEAGKAGHPMTRASRRNPVLPTP